MHFCMTRGLVEQSPNLQNQNQFRTSRMWQNMCSHRWMHVTTRPIHGDARPYFCAERRRIQDGAVGWLMEVYWRSRATKFSRDSTALGVESLTDDVWKSRLGQGAWVEGFLVVTFHPPYDHGSRAGLRDTGTQGMGDRRTLHYVCYLDVVGGLMCLFSLKRDEEDKAKAVTRS